MSAEEFPVVGHVTDLETQFQYDKSERNYGVGVFSHTREDGTDGVLLRIVRESDKEVFEFPLRADSAIGLGVRLIQGGSMSDLLNYARNTGD